MCTIIFPHLLGLNPGVLVLTPCGTSIVSAISTMWEEVVAWSLQVALWRDVVGDHTVG